MSTILVTGGAGFIGGNLGSHLVERGHRVVALDDLSTGDRAAVHPDVELVVGDLTDPGTIGPLVAAADAVVHLGARPSVPRSIADPVASHHANATGTLQVLEAARRAGDRGQPAPHVVIASSSSVYGANPTLPKSEDLVCRPMSPYAASKLASEGYAAGHASAFGLDVLVFRFFNVYGPGQLAGHAYAAAIPTFIAAALAGEPITVHGDGTQTRDFTFVDTVAAVLTDAVERRVSADGPVNLALGTRTSLLDVVHELERQLGKELSRHHTASRAGDVPHSQADPTRLHGLFPSIPTVSLADGIAHTLAWHQAQAPAR